MTAEHVLACAVCLGPGHQTAEAVGYAILALLVMMVPLFIGVMAFFIKIHRRAKAVAAGKRAGALR